MRFFETILSGAALIAAALALEINDYPTNGVVAGRTYTITYSPKDNTPTTFILRQGESTDLNTIQTITTTATGGTFQWTVPENLPDQPNYALEIQQGTTINYSAQFGLTGGSKPASSAASAASSTRASASSAIASAASSASAHISSIASAVSSAAASVTASASANGTTVSSATLSRTASSARASGTSSANVPQSTGAASSLASSSLAAILAIAGFAYLA